MFVCLGERGGTLFSYLYVYECLVQVYVIAQSFPYPVMKTEPLIELTEQQPVSSSKSADLYADVQSVGGGGGATPSLPSASTWTLGASKLMAPTHLMARRTQQPKAAPPAHKRIVMNTSVTVVQEGGGSVLASDNKSGGAGGETVVGIHDALPGASSRAKTGADSLTAQQFVDEYDPARPNEYAVFLKEMRQVAFCMYLEGFVGTGGSMRRGTGKRERPRTRVSVHALTRHVHSICQRTEGLKVYAHESPALSLMVIPLLLITNAKPNTHTHVPTHTRVHTLSARQMRRDRRRRRGVELRRPRGRWVQGMEGMRGTITNNVEDEIEAGCHARA